MYDIPLVTIAEVSADEYEELGGPVPFNDPDFKPMVRVTIDTGLTQTTRVCLLERAVLQHISVEEP